MAELCEDCGRPRQVCASWFSCSLKLTCQALTITRLRAELAALKGAGGAERGHLFDALALDLMEAMGVGIEDADPPEKVWRRMAPALAKMREAFASAPPPQQPGVSGEREPVKLDARMAGEIRSRYRAGESPLQLALDYNTTLGAVLRAFDEENDDV